MHHPFTVTRIRVDNHRTRTIFFKESLNADPGQFVMAWLPGVDEKPFSISGKEPLCLTVVAVGRFSLALHDLRPGDRLWLRGPLGKGFLIEGKRILLAAGGYGVAPLLFLAQEASKQECDIVACIGSRSAKDLLLVKEFAEIGMPVMITTEDGAMGLQGYVTQAMEQSIQIRRPDCVYACGPIRMLAGVEQQCTRYKLIHQLSWEAHMRCGSGLCGSCELKEVSLNPAHPKGWLVCLDGPVSRLAPDHFA